MQIDYSSSHYLSLSIYIWYILPSKTNMLHTTVIKFYQTNGVWLYVQTSYVACTQRFHWQSIAFTTPAHINLSPFITLFLFQRSSVNLFFRFQTQAFMAVWEDTLNHRDAECEMQWLIINHSLYWLTGKIGQSKTTPGGLSLAFKMIPETKVARLVQFAVKHKV